MYDEPDLDPFGCAFQVNSTVIDWLGGYSLDLCNSRTSKMINLSSMDAVAGKPANYKLNLKPIWLVMMKGPESFNLRRRYFTLNLI